MPPVPSTSHRTTRGAGAGLHWSRNVTQIVFLHGPGAGGCADAWLGQTGHFPDSLAPTLPGHLEGAPCADVRGYAEWVRGWLWARGRPRDLVLVGYTLGAAIALEYGLAYPDEVAGLALMTLGLRASGPPPGRAELRLKAAEGDPAAYAEWLAFQDAAMRWVAPDLRAHLLERHRQVGPLSQYHDLMAIWTYDAADRIGGLRPKLLLVRGADDANSPHDREREIHAAVPGSRYVSLPQAGHFPATERPEAFNALLEEFVQTLER
jgi:pimeloyl-ACP methyl ester carboxylesterase